MTSAKILLRTIDVIKRRNVAYKETSFTNSIIGNMYKKLLAIKNLYTIFAEMEHFIDKTETYSPIYIYIN